MLTDASVPAVRNIALVRSSGRSVRFWALRLAAHQWALCIEVLSDEASSTGRFPPDRSLSIDGEVNNNSTGLDWRGETPHFRTPSLKKKQRGPKQSGFKAGRLEASSMLAPIMKTSQKLGQTRSIRGRPLRFEREKAAQDTRSLGKHSERPVSWSVSLGGSVDRKDTGRPPEAEVVSDVVSCRD